MLKSNVIIFTTFYNIFRSVRLQAKKTIDLYLQRALKLISIIDDTSKTDNSDSLNTYEPKATSKTNLSVSKNNSKGFILNL